MEKTKQIIEIQLKEAKWNEKMKLPRATNIEYGSEDNQCNKVIWAFFFNSWWELKEKWATTKKNTQKEYAFQLNTTAVYLTYMQRDLSISMVALY